MQGWPLQLSAVTVDQVTVVPLIEASQTRPESRSDWLIGEPGWERIAAGSLDWPDHVVGHGAQRVSGTI